MWRASGKGESGPRRQGGEKSARTLIRREVTSRALQKPIQIRLTVCRGSES